MAINLTIFNLHKNPQFKMAKTPKNHGKEWTRTDVNQLKQLANQNTPTRIIALKMQRTPDSVRNAASQQGVSLKPTNQSPYGTQK